MNRADMFIDPRRIAGTTLERLQAMPGFDTFREEASALALFASTPGWEDADGTKTVPGAKPIGMSLWGMAMMTAALVVEAEPSAGWPHPGVDPGGFLWLTWRAGAAELALELTANLLHQSYRWASVRDGMPQTHESRELGDVVEAIRAMRIGAKKDAN